MPGFAAELLAVKTTRPGGSARAERGIRRLGPAMPGVVDAPMGDIETPEFESKTRDSGRLCVETARRRPAHGSRSLRQASRRAAAQARSTFPTAGHRYRSRSEKRSESALERFGPDSAANGE